MTTHVTVTALLLLGTLGAPGCLPADTRPEPGRVYVTTDLPTALRETQTTEGQLTFTTDDGWSVTLTRLFVAMGNLDFVGGGLSDTGCNEYAEARYSRVLDLQQPGPQKLGQIWGLNSCLVRYSLSRPNTDAVLGAGITASDRTFMQNASVPVSSPTGLTTAKGMALHLQGSAEKAGVVVGFDWGFADALRWTDCHRRLDGALESALLLVGGETIELNIEVDPRALFRATAENADPNAAPADVSLMQLMADADALNGNANGRIAVDELINTSMPSELSPLSLSEYLRLRSYPSAFGFAGDGQCTLELNQGRRGPGGMM